MPTLKSTSETTNKTKIMNEMTKQLADTAAIIATHGAKEYLRVHNLTASNQALSESLRVWIKKLMPLALADAKEAFDCHMDQIAVETFKASLINAGVLAAKECGMPIPAIESVNLLN